MRRRAHELSHLKRQLLALSIIFISLLSATTFLMSQYTSRVKVSLDVADINSNTITQYEQYVNQYYNQNTIERFSFFLDPHKLLAFIQSNFPEVERLVSIEQKGIFTAETTLHLSTRIPVAKWTISDQDYFVDGVGKAFTTNYHDDPAVHITDENHLNIKLGETTIASNRFLEFVGRLVSDLHSQGLSVSRAVIPVGMSREFDVVVEGYSYRFKLSIDRSPAEQAEDIKRILKHFDLNPRQVSSGVEYIDIRTVGKAFYR